MPRDIVHNSSMTTAQAWAGLIGGVVASALSMQFNSSPQTLFCGDGTIAMVFLVLLGMTIGGGLLSHRQARVLPKSETHSLIARLGRDFAGFISVLILLHLASGWFGSACA